MLCGLVEGNRELLRAVERSTHVLTMYKPDANVSLELMRTKQRLVNERAANRQKIQRLEHEHETALVNIVNESEKRVEAQANAYTGTVQSLRADLAVALANSSATEQEVAQERSRRAQLEARLAVAEEAAKKLEKARSKRDLEIKDLKAERETRECSLCMAVDWDTALTCGHCYCFSCVKGTCKETCPTCRKKTGGEFIKLFNCRQ
jgi:chromosome segregation ATPase